MKQEDSFTLNVLQFFYLHVSQPEENPLQGKLNYKRRGMVSTIIDYEMRHFYSEP